MSSLIIKAYLDSKHYKTWKLNSKKTIHVIGSSRFSDIKIPGDKFSGAIEFSQDKWHWVDIKNSLIKKQLLDKDTLLKINDVELSINQFSGYLDLTEEKMVIEDTSMKKQGLALASLCLILGLLMIFAKKQDQINIEIKNYTQTPLEFKYLAPKKQNREKSSNTNRQSSNTTSNASDTSSSGKRSKQIMNLLGHISAKNPSSKNIVLTTGQGIKNPNFNSNLPQIRGIASTQTNGKIGIGNLGTSTNIKNIGGLSQEKVGQSGGVGLIEDESEIVGGLDREVIAQYIKTQLGQILYCYERQLSAEPSLFGKVSVRFTIGPQGLIEDKKIGETTLKNATVEGCILQKVATWKFPVPEGGSRVIVTYPFLFKSMN